jgi:hypothetical protein
VDKNYSTQHEKVICDLEFSTFQDELENLEMDDLVVFEKSIQKIQQMTWQQIYQTSSKTKKRGLN